jgi:hypothetical protein
MATTSLFEQFTRAQSGGVTQPALLRRGDQLFNVIASGSGSAPGSTSASATGTVSGTGGSTIQPGDLTTLLGDIPIANDGDVIYADYHNSLRSALLALAGYLGQGVVNGTTAQTLAPALLPDQSSDGNQSWTLSPQVATADGGAQGWLPLELPDGARIEAISILDQHDSGADITVSLDRYSLATPAASAVTLARIVSSAGDGTVRTESAQLSPVGISDQATIEAMRQVDNGSYRYVIHAEADAGDASAAVLGAERRLEQADAELQAAKTAADRVRAEKLVQEATKALQLARARGGGGSASIYAIQVAYTP